MLRKPSLAFAVVLTFAMLTSSSHAVSTAEASSSTLSYKRLANPSRTNVYDSGKWVATFTDGSRTVTVAGPRRTFAEPTAADVVRSTEWVRLHDEPFDGRVDTAWLKSARQDTSPDVLATAMQYIAGAPQRLSPDGLVIAGDAAYGPLQSDGTRQEGSDFNDYLGVGWTYGDTYDSPESSQYGALDCSGFVRMVFGYRHGVPLSLTQVRGALPRRAVQQEAYGPGTTVIANTGEQATSLAKLAAGDLVFFDAASDDGTAIDHVGIYVGRDEGGRYRFISSRKTPNGPTLGDEGARSVLDGSGYYATAFRSVRRV